MIRSTVQFNFNRSPRPQVLATRFRHRGGFSLIEVAIAMAIFVFGALAIVRIFPGALGVVQNSEQRAIGQRMAQSTLTRLNTEPRSIPFALFDTNSALNAATLLWSDYPGAVYGTPNNYDNNSLSLSAPEAGDLLNADSALNRSAMGHFRRVFSETHRVPTNPALNGEVLLNFPYVVAPPTFSYAINPIIKVRRDVEGVTVDSGGTLNFSNARLQGSSALFRDSDGSAGHEERPPVSDPTFVVPEDATTQSRSVPTFYVSYNWRTAAGYINGVQDEPKKFGVDSAWGVNSAKVAQAAAGATILASSVKIWFYSSAAATTTEQGDANFDPNLGRLQLSAYAGQTVSVDYTVPDWRFIVTDNNLTTQVSDADTTYLKDQGLMPGATSSITQLVLPTRYVADEPLGNNDAQLYALLRGRTSTNMPVVSRAAWSPGFTDPASVKQADANNFKALAVRAKTGQVFFDTNQTAVSPPNPLISPMARVVYRNIEGWVQQPAIAANFYTPYVDGADRALFPREPWREYIYKAGATANADKAIFFHASEAGKSVTTSYVYLENGNYITMRDVPIPIEADVIDTPSNFPTAFNGDYSLNGAITHCAKVSLAYLRDNQGRSIGASITNGGNATAQIIAISEIRGASIRVRSGWFDGSRYTQTSVVGYRPLDVESYNRS